jgi:DNA-binding winged helix-turn-helix (wHTH) protein/TolB-like protein
MSSSAHRTTNCQLPVASCQSLHAKAWRFGDCDFDEKRRELRVQGKVVELEAKPLEVLHQLLLHGGDLVTKEELLEAVWPGVAVVDGSLATAVSKLRKRIEHDGQTVVLTVPRVGYRLAVPVRNVAAESGWAAPQPPTLEPDQAAIAPIPVRTARRPQLFWVLGAVTVLIAVAVVAFTTSGKSSAAAPHVKSIAVLPFENAGGDRSLDPLRLALPGQIVTILSDSHVFSVRPFATSSKYKDSRLNLQKAAREMHVETIVTGHYLSGNGKLHVTLEAIDVENNRLLWQDTLDAPVQNMLALQAAIAARARGPLSVALGPPR